MKDVSVVIPFYNEEENIDFVCGELCSVLTEKLDRTWEVILVNDGSSDNTPNKINTWAEKEGFRAVHLKQNQGQSAALFAGFNSAAGTYIFTLDGDGQNDPNDIPHLLEALETKEVDMICGIRAKRNDNIIRKLSSKLANSIRSSILNDNISDVGCSSRGFKRECLQGFRFFKNAHRFFPALFQTAGYSVAEIPVNHRSRSKGTSKYGAGINSRIWAGLFDLFGVYWMKRRYLNVQYFEQSKDQNNG